MSIKIDELNDVLRTIKIAPEKAKEILDAAEALELEKKNDRASDSKPKSKYKLAVFIRGDKELQEKVAQAWVVKVKEDVEEITIQNKLSWAVGAQNGAAKKNKSILETWADAFEFLKRKFTKDSECDVNILTKEPVRVVVLENERVDGAKVVE